MRLVLALAAALLLPASAGQVAAHHSFAMFDRTREVTVTGKVHQFQWSNPHAYIQLVAENERGEDVEWSLEMGSPMYLYSRGWRPRTLRPGMDVRVKLNPLRNGQPGGVVLEVFDAEGKQIGTNQ